MNIIYINTHDSGRFFSPYGYKVPSPSIESLARESILFRQAYCASPTCSPSRGALLTGQYPTTNGLIGLSHRGFSLNNYEHHLAAYLKSHGYLTVLSGTEHIANLGLGRQHDMNYNMLPYDKILGPANETSDLENAEGISQFIKDHNPDEQPFFISFGLWNTHRKYPNHIVEGYEPQYLKVPDNMFDNGMNREDFAHYCASLSIADQCVGTVIKALKDSGVYDDTIIILTTDHGLPNPYSKCNLYDAGIGVALIMRVPGSPLNGKASDELFSQIDLFPTLCSLVKEEIPPWIQGKDQSELIMGRKSDIRDMIYAEVNHHVSFEPMRAIRTKDFKYIKVYHDYPKVMLANVDDSVYKKQLITGRSYSFERAEAYLFDLHRDPGEGNNLINHPGYLGVRRSMEEALDKQIDMINKSTEKRDRQKIQILTNPATSLSPKEVYPAVNLII